MESEAVWRMMPDYGGECLWHVGGSVQTRADVSPTLRQKLDGWVREWAQFHDCAVRDDAHEAWVVEGRRLYELAADELRPFGVRLLADFEGSDDEQVERRKAWAKRWRSISDHG
jgi:hypothetical protein